MNINKKITLAYDSIVELLDISIAEQCEYDCGHCGECMAIKRKIKQILKDIFK